MDNANPFIDTHTHTSLTGTNIAIVNILLPDTLTGAPNVTPTSLSLSQNPYTCYSVGIHPWYIDNWESNCKLLEELASNPNVIAIGECGLDKIHEPNLGQQKQAFLFQISLSENLKKPLIVHCVKAFNELIQLRKTAKPQMPWIIHGFNGSKEVTRQCIESGMTLSFGKSLLNKDSNAAKALKSIDDNHFLLETDENDTPIEEIYSTCADIRGISVEQLKVDMYRNFKHSFLNSM